MSRNNKRDKIFDTVYEIELSKDPDIIDEIANKKYACDEAIMIYGKISKNPNTSAKTLAFLAKESVSAKQNSIIHYIACHENTSGETLEFLSRISDKMIRNAIAGNKNTQKHVLKFLYKMNVHFRRRVFENPNTSKSLKQHYLLELMGDLVFFHANRMPRTP